MKKDIETMCLIVVSQKYMALIKKRRRRDTDDSSITVEIAHLKTATKTSSSAGPSSQFRCNKRLVQLTELGVAN